MKRNIVLLLLLLIAGTAAWYVWKNKRDPSSSFQRSESNFKVEDVNTIGRIIIINKDGSRSDLRRHDAYWTINDNHRARQTNVDNLLRGINRQHMDYIPNRAATADILKSIAVNGIHVQIYDRQEKPILAYYVGGVTQDEGGTFFLKEGSQQPYTLIEPGFEGGLRARYALRPVDWRDVRFWIEDTDAIDTLKVDYPKDRQHSFKIFRKGNSYDILPLYSTTPLLDKSNDNKMKSYFTTLSRLACENFLPESRERDSIIAMVPYMRIDMVYPDKTSYLKFYEAVVPAGQASTTDVPSFYLDYNGKDFMIAQQEVIKGAFRSYNYFFE